jgi:AcrR family transcriptional regulator
MDAVITRPRDAAKTRARILEAAYLAFSDGGYGRTGIREIADAAEVASSLILRYFGNKAKLFEEALAYGIHRDSLFTYDKPGFGQWMARMIADNADTRLTAMTVLAVADPESNEAVTRVARHHIIAPLAEWLGGADADARAQALFALMTGYTIQRRLLGGAAMPKVTVDWLARQLQQVVDGEACAPIT